MSLIIGPPLGLIVHHVKVFHAVVVDKHLKDYVPEMAIVKVVTVLIVKVTFRQGASCYRESLEIASHEPVVIVQHLLVAIIAVVSSKL